MQKNTQCVHSGSLQDTLSKGVNTPIFTSTAFKYLETPYNTYPRFFNTPNQRVIIDKLCALENTENGVLFSSGMAAISTVLFSLLKSGDHIIIQRDIYGGTHHFITSEFEKFKIEYSFISNNTKEIEKVIKKNTKIIYIESPSNPLLAITDIGVIAKIAKSENIISITDNTFATPINQNPHESGIDIIVHSGTKYFGGHSDICCGAALTTNELTEKIKECALNFGGSLNASTCYLLERSLKTLNIRVNRQNQNAYAIAKAIQTYSNIKKVYYPGLKSHPGHEIAEKQMRGFGAMVSFELDEQKIKPEQFLRRLKLIAPTLSLGGVESTICAPAATSHAKLTPEECLKLGITDGLIRLSTGIEDVEDLLSDIKQAL
mmetsp:Transcript_1547/g.1062  ORF Transcript_1547/g.1062 Transcript_1547/m.1062 type:complete len:375 (-) Transcript_1547:318-1442(-)